MAARDRLLAALAAASLLATAMASTAVPDVRLAGHGQRARLQALRANHPAIVVFWRSDCVPCREELQKLPALRRQARPLRLMLVAVESAQESRGSGPSAAKLLAADDSWRALDDPARTLADFGGRPPRLPLSVLLDGEGVVRARRHGELGPLLVREWRRCAEGASQRCVIQ